MIVNGFEGWRMIREAWRSSGLSCWHTGWQLAGWLTGWPMVAGAGWEAGWPQGPQEPSTRRPGKGKVSFGGAQNQTFIKKPSNYSQRTRD